MVKLPLKVKESILSVRKNNMISNLENKLAFIELLDEMKNIKRAIRLSNGEKENNAEHSFDIAMIVSILVGDFPYLDTHKCIQMALYHDLVEIFAWDTVLFDVQMEQTKQQREADALLQLEQVLWPHDFQGIKEIVWEYEQRKTLESLFVWQIDKIHPIIQIVKHGWVTWHEYKMDIKKVMEKKYSQIDDTFWFRKILDQYFQKAQKEDMVYRPE